jgi:hypothetical protein
MSRLGESRVSVPSISDVPSEVIVWRRRVHCARGERACEKCRRTQNCWMLIELNPSGEYARPMVPVEIGGQPILTTYDQKKLFKSEAEARAYASEHEITLIERSSEADSE